MTTCNECQDVLLDMLYDLVDASQKQQLEAHLAACSACEAALAYAKRQQQLFARASHLYRAVPVFSAPEEHIADGNGTDDAAPQQVPEPAILSFSDVSPRKRRRWARLAAAAAVLLAVAGLGGFYQQRLHHHQAEFAGAEKRIHAVDGRSEQLAKTYAERQASLPKEIPGRFMNVQVSGPARLEADAPPSVRVVTRDSAGALVNAEITAVLKQEGKELFKKALSSNGDATLTLPSGLVRQKMDAELLVIARHGETAHRVGETVHVDEPTLVTHLVTNKSIYQVGERVLFRTLTLKRFSLQPPDEPVKLKFSIRSTDGRMPLRRNIDVGPGGIGGGEWALPINLLTGDYVLHVEGTDDSPRFVAREHRITIVRDLPAQLNFDRRSYQAGDLVKARFQAGRPFRGKVAPNQLLRAWAEVDGKKVSVNGADTVEGAEVKTDTQGGADIQLKLPASMKNEKARIEIAFPATDKEKAEKLIREIPLAGSEVKIELFPEGGELVAGVLNRIYYRTRNHKGELVHGRGQVEVLTQEGKIVASAAQDGPAGFLVLTPAAKANYRVRMIYGTVKIESAEPFKEHPIRERGLVMSVAEGVSGESGTLRVLLHNTSQEQRLLVMATCRGHVVAQRLITSPPGDHEVPLSFAEGARGVVRVTVCRAGDNRLTPLAERLIYRVPAESLKLDITNLKKVYHPGEEVKWQIETKTELGAPTPAWMLAAVIEEKVLGAADKKAGTPPTHFYLTTELNRPEDLDEADLLLVDSPEGRKALDLFLGTQGWRKFVPAAEGPDAPAVATAAAPMIFRRENETPAKLAALTNAELTRSLTALRQDTIRQRKELQEDRKQTESQAKIAAALLAEWRNLPAVYLRTGAGMLSVVLLLAGGVFLVLGAVRMVRQITAPSRAFVGAFGALTACLVLYASSGSFPDVDSGLSERLTAELSKNNLPALSPDRPAPVYAAAASVQTGVFALVATQGAAVENPAFQEPASIASDLQERFTKEPLTNRAPEPTPLKPMQFKPRPPANPKGTLPMIVPIEMLDPRLRSFATKPSTDPSTADTLLWHPILFSENGSAEAAFGIPGNLSTFRIYLYGNSPSGRLGTFQATMQVRPK